MLFARESNLSVYSPNSFLVQTLKHYLIYFALATILAIVVTDCHAQKSFIESLEFKGEAFEIDSLPFEIKTIINQNPKGDTLGVVFYGEEKEKAVLALKPSLEKQAKSFFKDALKQTKKKERALIIVIKQLQVEEVANDEIDFETIRKL